MKKFVKAVLGMNHSVIYTDEDGKSFRFFEGTWAWRNHNPGNIFSGKISKRHGQIGSIYDFAVFPDDDSGRKALIDSLQTTFCNMSIHTMIYQYAPPKDNPTKKYESLLRKMTGVYDDTPIKDFTSAQFKNLWKGIEKMEGYKPGKIVEAFPVTGVQVADKNVHQYLLKDGDWISKSQCIALAKQAKVELEVCTSDRGNTFLRSYPDSRFQEKLTNLIIK